MRQARLQDAQAQLRLHEGTLSQLKKNLPRLLVSFALVNLVTAQKHLAISVQ